MHEELIIKRNICDNKKEMLERHKETLEELKEQVTSTQQCETLKVSIDEVESKQSELDIKVQQQQEMLKNKQEMIEHFEHINNICAQLESVNLEHLETMLNTGIDQMNVLKVTETNYDNLVVEMQRDKKLIESLYSFELSCKIP